jgi:hypothetical protein
MTDIAVDRDGNMFGVAIMGPQVKDSQGTLVFATIDQKTGHCEVKLSVPQNSPDGAGSPQLQGLTFVPKGTVDPDADALVGYDLYGNYTHVDLAGGKLTTIGTLLEQPPIFDAVWRTKGGEAVSIDGDKTYATVAQYGSGPVVGEPQQDWLVALDPSTGGITEFIAQNTPWMACNGLAYWAGTIYCFGYDAQIWAIDMATKLTTTVALAGENPGVKHFYGAGVTTIAPIEPPK